MTDTTKRMGRPPSKPTENHFKYNALHDLLVCKLDPRFLRADLSAPQGQVVETLQLSRALGVSRYTLYRTLNNDRVSKHLAHRLVGLPGTLTLEDLLPFVMRL